jgi:hypothetical protein
MQQIDKMVSLGSQIQKIKHTALAFCRTMKLSSGKLASIAKHSIKKRASRLLRAL